LECVWDRFGTGLVSIWMGVAPVYDRFGIDGRSVWNRFEVIRFGTGGGIGWVGLE
jgi:hypothetical protein